MRMATAGLASTFKSETYFGGKTVLGGGEGEMRVKGRKKEAQERGISKKELLAVWLLCLGQGGVSVGFGQKEVVSRQ